MNSRNSKKRYLTSDEDEKTKEENKKK